MTRDELRLKQIDADTANLQTELWSAVRTERPTPTVALAVSGMNDVLNAQGYTQAAWWNRIPGSAWGLIAAIAICCNMLLGYCAHKTNWLLFLVFALVVSTSIFLIADIDSPRGGVIRVLPQIWWLSPDRCKQSGQTIDDATTRQRAWHGTARRVSFVASTKQR